MRSMKAMTTLAALVALGGQAACSGGADPFAPPLLAPARLAGSYTAQSAIFTSTFNPSTQFNVISQDGEFRFDLGSGRFASTLTLPGQQPLVRTGDVVIAGDRLILTDDGATASRTFPFTMEARTLRFTDPVQTFDFDGSGVLRPAALSVVLVR
jgi:hypothetical protein